MSCFDGILFLKKKKKIVNLQLLRIVHFLFDFGIFLNVDIFMNNLPETLLLCQHFCSRNRLSLINIGCHYKKYLRNLS